MPCIVWLYALGVVEEVHRAGTSQFRNTLLSYFLPSICNRVWTVGRVLSTCSARLFSVPRLSCGTGLWESSSIRTLRKARRPSWMLLLRQRQTAPQLSLVCRMIVCCDYSYMSCDCCHGSSQPNDLYYVLAQCSAIRMFLCELLCQQRTSTATLLDFSPCVYCCPPVRFIQIHALLWYLVLMAMCMFRWW